MPALQQCWQRMSRSRSFLEGACTLLQILGCRHSQLQLNSAGIKTKQASGTGSRSLYTAAGSGC